MRYGSKLVENDTNELHSTQPLTRVILFHTILSPNLLRRPTLPNHLTMLPHIFHLAKRQQASLTMQITSSKVRHTIHHLIDQIPQFPLFTPRLLVSLTTKRRRPDAFFWHTRRGFVAIVFGSPDDDWEEVVSSSALWLVVVVGEGWAKQRQFCPSVAGGGTSRLC